MKKKILMLLLATTLTLSACGSAKTPADAPVSTEVAKNVEVSAEAVEGTKETEAAKVTVAPVKEVEKTVEPTPAPAVTEAPAATQTPAVTSTPAPTATPEVKATPEKTPAPTEAPKATETPEPTIESEETKEPEATATLEPTKEPEETEKPKAEETPEPTKEPEVEKTPEPTEEPKVEATPEPTPAECDHDWEMEVVAEPTCTSGGHAYERCSKCGKSKGGSGYTLDMLDHDYDSGEEVLAGDCNTPSIIRYTCKDCGSSYEDEGSTTGEHDWKTKEGMPTVDMVTGELVPGETITYCDECGARP